MLKESSLDQAGVCQYLERIRLRYAPAPDNCAVSAEAATEVATEAATEAAVEAAVEEEVVVDVDEITLPK